MANIKDLKNLTQLKWRMIWTKGMLEGIRSSALQIQMPAMQGHSKWISPRAENLPDGRQLRVGYARYRNEVLTNKRITGICHDSGSLSESF